MAPPKPIHSVHPFYISVTEINHNAKEKMLEISCKLFADDLEQVLSRTYKTKLDFADARYKPQFDKFINDYISRNLSVAADNKAALLHYVGFEIDKESAFCYFQINNIATLKKIDIANSILYDFNDNEINIIHTVVNGKRQSTKLDFPATKASFDF